MADATKQNQETVKMWTANMLSLESHIEEALDRQLKEVQDHQQANQAVQKFHAMVKSHRDELKQYLKTLGGEPTSPIKDAITGLFGVAAGVIDRVRSEAVSKALRDDYTAFNLAAVGYHMLNTTATALGDAKTAGVAQRFLKDYAGAVQHINQIIADVVVWELKKDDHRIADTMAVSTTTRQLNEIWQATSPGGVSGATRTAGA